MRNLPLAKLIDIPPMWLLGMCVLAWCQSQFLTFGLSIDSWLAKVFGSVLVAIGVILMLLAVWVMHTHRTTVIPHLNAQHLVSSGIFARSRNPIYLGDVLVLSGLILRWDAVLALALVPVFIGILQNRFIIPEEQRLAQSFPSEFADYCQRVRRWL